MVVPGSPEYGAPSGIDTPPARNWCPWSASADRAGDYLKIGSGPPVRNSTLRLVPLSPRRWIGLLRLAGAPIGASREKAGQTPDQTLGGAAVKFTSGVIAVLLPFVSVGAQSAAVMHPRAIVGVVHDSMARSAMPGAVVQAVLLDTAWVPVMTSKGDMVTFSTVADSAGRYRLANIP